MRNFKPVHASHIEMYELTDDMEEGVSLIFMRLMDKWYIQAEMGWGAMPPEDEGYLEQLYTETTAGEVH